MDKIKDHVPFVDETVLNIKAEAFAIEAAERMRDQKMSALIVVKGGENLGIVTETDLSRKIIADRLDPATTKVKFIMSNPIVTIDSTKSMMTAFLEMGKYNLRHIAVVDSGIIVGILSIREFVNYYNKKFGQPLK